MKTLSEIRPIFRSEDDFQESFEQEIQKSYPDYVVTREYTPPNIGRNIRIDLWVKDPQGGIIVIELKYPTIKLDVLVNNEQYNLSSHSAQDLTRYDFLKDVERNEEMIQRYPNTSGFAIMITNDSLFWRDTEIRDVVDADFRIHEGQMIHGSLSWSSKASPGTMKTRERSLDIKGKYTMNWYDYSTFDQPFGKFRYLIVRADTTQ